MGRPAALPDLGVDRTGDVVAGRQFRGPPGICLATLGQRLDPARRLLIGLRIFGTALVRQVLPHEPLAIGVPQDPAFAAHGFRDQEPADAGWPDHARWMELHELHVDQFGAGLVCQRLAIAAVLP